VLANALFSETKSLQFTPGGDNPGDFLDNVDLLLAGSISGSLGLGVGSNSFDVIAVLNVNGNIPGSLVSSFDLDFSNTASLNIASTVPFTSNSGVFLTGQNNISAAPIPGTAALMLLGVAGIRRHVARRSA